MTVKDQTGKQIFSKQKEYAVYNFHFAENKEGYRGFNDWDITAKTQLDLGLKPGKTDSQIFVLPLKKDTKSVSIEAVFSYVYEEGKKTPIHTVIKKVEF